jgi:hypothetical protein
MASRPSGRLPGFRLEGGAPGQETQDGPELPLAQFVGAGALGGSDPELDVQARTLPFRRRRGSQIHVA